MTAALAIDRDGPAPHLAGVKSIHATCVALGGVGILLRGPSGSGKSDLALRLIDQGARLVADDRVVLREDGGELRAEAPPRLRGLLEVRGVGPITVPSVLSVAVRLIVDLAPSGEVERLPDAAFDILEGKPIARHLLSAFEASAPAKIRLLARLTADVPAVEI
ncbi:HPr kinase/phosphatase C-terminal domain-containing protein [Inquilinus sp. CAU 1745]|uniref:HPr kinase/phosphorylase n=1 Tax=Inquilinus sp. CAU 1745 TaxID=3140369 RepID=UPI00325A453A